MIDVHKEEVVEAPPDESISVVVLLDTEASKEVPAAAHAPCAHSMKDCRSF